MFIEIFANDIFSQADIQKCATSSIHQIEKFCIPGCMLKYINYSGLEKLSLLVDYPYGLASTNVRQKEISDGYNNHIKNFDITISRFAMINEYYDHISNDLRLITSFVNAKDKNIKLRCLIDFNLCNKKSILAISEIIDYHGIEHISLSTGYSPIDIDDQIIALNRVIKKLPLKVTVGPIFSEKQYDIITKNTDIYSVFFQSYRAMSNFTKIK